MDLLNPDFKLQSMYINLLKQLKSKKDAMASKSPGGDLDKPTYQRQGKTRGDMGIAGEYTSDGTKVPGPNEIASGKIESVEESMEEAISRNAIDKMAGSPAQGQIVMMAIKKMKEGQGLSPEYASAFYNFIGPVLDSLSGTDAVASLDRHADRFDDTPQDAPEIDSQEEPQSQDDNIDSTTMVGQFKSHPELGKVRIINVDGMKPGEVTVQTDSGSMETVKTTDLGESIELEALDLAELKKLAGLSEAMSDAYNDAEEGPEQVEGSVEFKQHKNTDKGSVSVEASGETMQDLADVLKLAGLTLPQDMHKDEPESDEPESDEPESDKEVCDCCGNEVVDGECGCGPECPHCGGEPEGDQVKVIAPSDSDASYSTDREVLVNYIKDKLAKRLS